MTINEPNSFVAPWYKRRGTKAVAIKVVSWQKLSSSQELPEVSSGKIQRGSGSAKSTCPGIGLAIARYLLHDGNNVVILARSRAPLEELKDQYPKQVRVLTGDMADFSIAKRAAGLATSEFGQIDGLVINHGQLSPVTRIADSNVEEWKISFDIGFFSAIELVSSLKS